MTRNIAFYLPQFHQIPENNMWWGEGFTEWSNVKRGSPLFDNHYQPHVPLNQDYYELTSLEVPLKQIHLAKKHGIDGFCFYFYWFNSKTILETPIRRWLNNKELDFPFCLCWANENWTRRWDGLDKEILLQQDYSPADDRRLIKYLIPYLKDKRYIRINNKPLIILYRPNLLPDAAFTARQWRYECAINGLGDIHLSYVQGFEKTNPSDYGFDSAIEFPPVGLDAREITHIVNKLPTGTKSTFKLYDYNSFLEFSECYPKVNYLLFRGTCTGWDNSSRRKNKEASILYNSNPQSFEKWLLNASLWSKSQSFFYQNNDLDIVFINAWNEWAEGCHLEPDEKYGYQWLESVLTVKEKIINSLKLANAKVARSFCEDRVCIVFHVYYFDLFELTLPRLTRLASFLPNLHVIITTIEEHKTSILNKLKSSPLKYSIQVNPNKGRDILPFIKAIDVIKRKNPKYIIKVHTKKSPHRNDGHEWFNSLVKDLLTIASFKMCLDIFDSDRSVGLISPKNSLVSTLTYLGSNIEKVSNLVSCLDGNIEDFMTSHFAAGSMFVAKPEVLDVLSNLNLTDHDFEEEQGQVDGTTIHSIERIISYGMHHHYGLKSISIDQKTGDQFKYADPTQL